MKFKRHFSPFVISLMLLFINVPPIHANQSGDIIWKHFILQPANIVGGKFAGQGHVQKIAGEIATHMPQYNHILEYGSFSKVFSDLQSRPGLCASGVKKTEERQKFLIFSEPVYVYFQARLVVRHDASKVFDGFVDDQGQIDLDALWRESDMEFSFVPGRRYGQVIDKFISSYRDYSPSRFWSHDSALRLLEAGRVQGAFLTPHESQFGILDNNYALSLKFYDIKGSVPLALAHIARVRSEWGEEIIHQIDRVLNTTDIREKGIDYFSEWLSDDISARYRSEARQLLNK